MEPTQSLESDFFIASGNNFTGLKTSLMGCSFKIVFHRLLNKQCVIFFFVMFAFDKKKLFKSITQEGCS